MRGLAETRTRAEGIFDLLVWDHHVPGGVLRHTDGAYSLTFAYRGPDLGAATADELDGLTRTLTAALDQLGDGWLVHFDLHRRPAPGYPAEGAFPNRFTRALDEERRRGFEAAGARYYSRYFLTLTQRPVGSAVDLALAVGGGAGAAEEREAREVEAFLHSTGELAALLGTQLSIRRLEPAEQVRYLHSCLCLEDQPVAVPPYAVSLEALVAGADFALGREIEVGGRRVVPIAVGNYPESVRAGALDFLSDLPIPLRAVFRYIPLDPATAQSAIGRRAGRWRQATVRWSDFLAALLGSRRDEGGEGAGAGPRRYEPVMVQDTDAARLEIEARGSSAGYLTAVILTWGDEPAVALERARLLLKELRNRGYLAQVETYNAPEAFLGSLPGHGWYDVRRPMVTHRALAALAPATSTWTGHFTHPHPALGGGPPHAVVAASGATPFYLCLASRDVQHTLVVGPTGSGKSTLVNFLIAQFFRYARAQVFSFDKGLSQLLLCQAAGGRHYALSAEAGGGLPLAPLARVEEPGGVQAAAEWLEELLRLAGAEVGPPERQALGRALELLVGSRSRSLSTLALKVQSEPLRRALGPFIGSGPYAHLFDAEQTPLGESALTVFELEDLLALKRSVVAPAVLHLFAEIERRLDGRPTLIVAEEAASYLDQTLFARRLREWLLQLRKRNAGLVVVAQMLGALLESSLRDAVLENCPVRIFLANPAARDEHAAKAYRQFGLNVRQIETVAAAVPRRDYYVVTPEGSRLVSLDLSPASLEVLGASGPGAREIYQSARDRHGERWLEGFLAGQGHEGFVRLLQEVDR